MHQLLVGTVLLVVIFTATITIGLGEKFQVEGRRNMLQKHTCCLSNSSVDI